MQGKIINSRYVFDFAKYDFVPKSIVILAVKFDLVELTFTYQGKRVKDLYCAEKSWVRDKMKQIFTETDTILSTSSGCLKNGWRCVRDLRSMAGTTSHI